MAHELVLVFLLPVAYLVGSIPVGLIVGLANGIDPRKAGSGNIGATNVGRLLGRKFFALVFTLDVLKGALPPLLAGWLIGFATATTLTATLWTLVGLVTVLGNMFSLFLRFKGGKGVATSAGMLLAIFPYFTLPGIGALLVFLICLKIWKYVSLGSMAGAAVFPILYIGIGISQGWDLRHRQLPLLSLAVLIPVLIIIKHRGNIARLRAGTESKVGQAKPA